MAPWLNRLSARRFTLPNGLGDHGEMLVTVDILQAYLEYDTHLRAGTASHHQTPSGYADFALTFNLMQTEAGRPAQMVQGGPDEPRITGPAPNLVELIGEESAAPTPPTPARTPEGGRYLNPQRAELLEEALWMNLETSKKKREWRDRSIAERRAARSNRHIPSVRGTRRNTPHVDQGEGSSTGPGTSSTPSSAPARMEVDEDVRSRTRRDDEDEAGEKEGGPASKKSQRKK
ncbi:hypothetical protein EDD22DRAFT_852717 [Suillus occidentalis]|nr:hypothetical protein EDD22DRAFT_852717 [Suillus occidentalis]